ncbi:hypothetical protein RFI_36333 [Reticulomyxa filosa]|uniref:Uncharacterized protein n=1 Tax=Reticulomyxa filosa TaxID=46433 RepID=X6LK54_RETFI|nr:hypothetical protein RFI_36333 [Reticulomyxa filosa]|eukprot:ETO01105.1 hypothetical protein RFI_36333 [Reticulomyxa filosa]
MQNNLIGNVLKNRKLAMNGGKSVLTTVGSKGAKTLATLADSIHANSQEQALTVNRHLVMGLCFVQMKAICFLSVAQKMGGRYKSEKKQQTKISKTTIHLIRLSIATDLFISFSDAAHLRMKTQFLNIQRHLFFKYALNCSCATNNYKSFFLGLKKFGYNFKETICGYKENLALCAKKN